jgi:hypothetical protein
VIVLDGRTDREKLGELLAAGEQTHLDYKENLDLSKKKAQLNLVKDIVTMSNRPGGGYILVGVDDSGTPCLSAGTLDRHRFDGAALGQLVRGYVEGQIEVHPQVHELENGREVVLIRVEGQRGGLPLPMAKIGQFRNDAGKDVIVFRPGEVLVREGSANVPLRYSHWPDLLSARDELVREQAQENINELVARVVSQLRMQTAGGPRSAPLDVGMDEATFAEAVISNLEGESLIRLQQFLQQALNAVSSAQLADDEAHGYLDRVTILAAQATAFRRDDVATAAIDTLYKIYKRASADLGTRAPRLLEIITRVYALGALAVRFGSWVTVRYAVQQQVESVPGSAYIYATWLRHAQVEGSRAQLFPADRGGMLISAARALVSDHPAMRPDVPDQAVGPADRLDDADELLNSLCQFDLAYCLTIAAEVDDRSQYYPACAAFHQRRADPVFEAVTTRPDVRQDLLITPHDQRVADALLEVHEVASRESSQFGGFWSELPPAARSFIKQHRSSGSTPT